MFVPGTCATVSIACNVAAGSPAFDARDSAGALGRALMSSHTFASSVVLVRYWISSRSA